MKNASRLPGVLRLSVWLCCLFLSSATSAWAAEYSVRFGELGGHDNKTLVPAITLKMCERSTGYRYQLEVVSPGGKSFDYNWVMTIPAPPAKLSYETAISSSGHGQQIKAKPMHATGRAAYTFWFDKGDPLGRYRLEVFVQKSLVKTISFNVVAASHCP